MSNTPGILTAIVLALSVFFAYKNKANYEEWISMTQGSKRDLETSTKRLDKAIDDVNTTQASLDETIAETERLDQETVARKEVNEELRLEFESKTRTVSSNNDSLGGMREKSAQIPDKQQLAASFRQNRSEAEGFSQNISDAEARLAFLTSSNTDAQALADSIRTRLDTYTAGRSLPTARTRIRAIYPTWGFVTLAAGNNAGIVSGSTLHIVRDEQVIGKLLVTAVESSSASASIVPDSISEDTVLMIGDSVVPPSEQDS